jgi:hypothetical protein
MTDRDLSALIEEKTKSAAHLRLHGRLKEACQIERELRTLRIEQLRRGAFRR